MGHGPISSLKIASYISPILFLFFPLIFSGIVYGWNFIIASTPDWTRRVRLDFFNSGGVTRVIALT